MFNTNLDTLLLLFRFRTGSMTDVNSYSFSARQCPEMVIDSCRWQTRRRKDFFNVSHTLEDYNTQLAATIILKRPSVLGGNELENIAVDGRTTTTDSQIPPPLNTTFHSFLTCNPPSLPTKTRDALRAAPGDW